MIYLFDTLDALNLSGATRSEDSLALAGLVLSIFGGLFLYAFARFVLGMKTRRTTARAILCTVWALSLLAGDLATTLLPILLPKSPTQIPH
jgi:hypothetical protein